MCSETVAVVMWEYRAEGAAMIHAIICSLEWEDVQAKCVQAKETRSAQATCRKYKL